MIGKKVATGSRPFLFLYICKYEKDHTFVGIAASRYGSGKSPG